MLFASNRNQFELLETKMGNVLQGFRVGELGAARPDHGLFLNRLCSLTLVCILFVSQLKSCILGMFQPVKARDTVSGSSKQMPGASHTEDVEVGCLWTKL